MSAAEQHRSRMREQRLNQLLDGERDGFWTAGYGEDEATTADTSNRAREQRARSDGFERQAAKGFTESLELAIEQRPYRFTGDVAGTNPGATRKHDRLEVGRSHGFHQFSDGSHVVAHEVTFDRRACQREHLLDQRS